MKYNSEFLDFELLKLEYDKDFPAVFGTVLDTYENVSKPTVKGQVYLWEVLQSIQYNFCQDISVSTYLTPKYFNGRKNTKYDKIKEGLPAVCYNARFDGYKNLKNLKSINNLMFLDIDDFSSREEALAYKKEIITKYDWIIACNLSLSRLGLHIIIMVDKIHSNPDFNRKYDYLSKTYFDSMLDKTSKSLSRFTILPSDYNIYINENPSILQIDSIINEKSISSVYIENSAPNDENNSKGTSSVYNADSNSNSENNEKGIGSAYIDLSSHDEGKSTSSCYREGEAIYTPCTFSNSSELKHYFNSTEFKKDLRFKQEVNEDLIEDPNVPLYIREGIDVIRINLFPVNGK